MLKRKNLLFLVVVSMLLGSCSSLYVTNYYPKKFNQKKLAELSKSGKKIKIGTFVSSNKEIKEIMCRMVGLVKTQSGEAFSAYIGNAFLNELEKGKLVSNNAKDEVVGNLLKIEMDSGPGNGFWKIKMSYKLNGNDWFEVDTHHEFNAGTEAISACDKTSQAFIFAVQQHVKQVIMNKKFQEYFSK